MVESKEKNSEFNVPVPWGHIAVKAWGEEINTPVLVVHGRMDNAGAFDHLISLLPKQFYYICIDLPGHGKSSHFPEHLPVFTINNILVYTLLMKHFQRKKYIILGHSYGAQIGLLYARLYPNMIDKLIMLDAIHIYPVSRRDYITYLREKFQKYMDMVEKHKSEPPIYSYKEAFERTKNKRENSPLTSQATKALLNRSLIKVGEDSYRFSLDQRMKCYLDPLHDFKFAVASLEMDPIKCPTLMLLTKGYNYQNNYMQPVLKEMEKLKNITTHYVEGDHDVHNNHPEEMASHITDFLLEEKSKL